MREVSPDGEAGDEDKFPPGSVVWAHLLSYPKWPGRVCDISWIQSPELPRRIPPGKRLVMFFNDEERFSIMEVGRLELYHFEDWKRRRRLATADPGIQPAALEADAYMRNWKKRKPGGAMDHGHLTDQYPLQPALVPDAADQGVQEEDPMSDVNSELSARQDGGGGQELELGREPEPEPAADTRKKVAGKTLPSSARRTAGKTVPLLPQKRVTAGSIFRDKDGSQQKRSASTKDPPEKDRGQRTKSKTVTTPTPDTVAKEKEKTKLKKRKRSGREGQEHKATSLVNVGDATDADAQNPLEKQSIAEDHTQTPPDQLPAADPNPAFVSKKRQWSVEAKAALIEKYSNLSKEQLLAELVEATLTLQKLKRSTKSGEKIKSTKRRKGNLVHSPTAGVDKRDSSEATATHQVSSPVHKTPAAQVAGQVPTTALKHEAIVADHTQDTLVEEEGSLHALTDDRPIPRLGKKRRRAGDAHDLPAVANAAATIYPTSMAGQAAFDLGHTREATQTDIGKRSPESASDGSPIDKSHDMESEEADKVGGLTSVKIAETGISSGSVDESPDVEGDPNAKVDLAGVREVDETEFIAGGRAITTACAAYLSELKIAGTDRSHMKDLELAVMRACDRVLSLSFDRDCVRELLSKSGLGKEMVQNVGNMKEHSKDLARKIKSVVTFWMQLVQEGEGERPKVSSAQGQDEKSGHENKDEVAILREQMTSVFDVYVRQLLSLPAAEPESAEGPTERAREIERAVAERAFGGGGYTETSVAFYKDVAKFIVRKLHGAHKSMNEGDKQNPYRGAWEMVLNEGLSIKSFVGVCQKSKEEAQAWYKKRKPISESDPGSERQT